MLDTILANVRPLQAQPVATYGPFKIHATHVYILRENSSIYICVIVKFADTSVSLELYAENSFFEIDRTNETTSFHYLSDSAASLVASVAINSLKYAQHSSGMYELENSFGERIIAFKNKQLVQSNRPSYPIEIPLDLEEIKTHYQNLVQFPFLLDS